MRSGHHPVLLALALLVAGLTFLPSRGWAAEKEREAPTLVLQNAESLYRAGELAEVIELLNGAQGILGDRPRLLDPIDLRRACVLAGSAHYFLGARGRAAAWFSRAIRLAPTRDLDPLRHPPELVGFFEQVRSELPDAAERWEPRDVFPELLRWRSDSLGFLPFLGLGFDQLRAPAVAALVRVFLATGVIGSVVTWLQLSSLRAVRNPELQTSRHRFRIANLAFVVVFYVALVIDVVGSLWLRAYRRAYPQRAPRQRPGLRQRRSRRGPRARPVVNAQGIGIAF